MLRRALCRCILPITILGAVNSAPAQQSSNSESKTFLLHARDGGNVDILSPVPQADQPTLENVIIPDLIKKTKAAWYPIIPPEAKPPKFLKGAVLIRFTLNANGRASNLVLEQSSGNIALDRAAWNSIHDTVYAPFPATVTMGEVKLRFAFLYNEKPGSKSSESPSAAQPDSTHP